MTSIAMNQAQLSRFSHHSWWGLRMDKKNTLTLYDEAMAIANDSSYRMRIQEKVAVMDRYSNIQRTFCWIINYKQYRTHCYQLAAYHALKLYQQTIAEETSNANTNASISYPDCFYLFGQPSAWGWFSRKIASFYSKKIIPTLLVKEKNVAVPLKVIPEQSPEQKKKDLPPPLKMVESSQEELEAYKQKLLQHKAIHAEQKRKVEEILARRRKKAACAPPAPSNQDHNITKRSFPP